MMMMMIPIEVTVIGIVTDVKFVHDAKVDEANDRLELMMMVVIVVMMIIPILVVVLLNVMKHGVEVHKLQQPVPVVLVHMATLH